MNRKLVTRRMWLNSVFVSAILLASTGVCKAVHPQSWNHQDQSDYVEGHFNNVVVDNYGVISLGRPLTEIQFAEEPTLVNAFAQTPDGKVYFSTTSDGAIYVINHEQAEIYYQPKAAKADSATTEPATLPASKDKDLEESEDLHDTIDPQVLALTTNAQGHILAAVCGDQAQVVELIPGTDGKPTTKTIATLPAKVHYIWSIKSTPDGSLYLATGPKGQIWKVTADGKASVWADVPAKNILNLAFDAQGNLLAGTDGHGQVIRFNAQTAKPFILLEAGEMDVTGLATDAAGNIYAAVSTPHGEYPGGFAEHEAKFSHPDEAESDDLSSPVDDAPAPTITDEPTTLPGKQHTAPATQPEARLGLPAQIFAADITSESMITTMPNLPPGISLSKLKSLSSGPREMRIRSQMQSRISRNHSNQNSSGHGTRAHGDDDQDGGNSVFKITPEGIVTSVFKSNDPILSLAVKDKEILVGTGSEGNGGKLFSIRPDTEAQYLIGRVHNENLMSLYTAPDGSVYCGTAGPATVYQLAAKPALQGTYVSDVLDARHTATWGSVFLSTSQPDGSSAKATIAVRTGNAKDIKKDVALWSNWTPEIAATGNVGIKLDQTAARYLQYRITLNADTAGQSPLVDQVKISYQVPNLPPKIKELIVDDGSANKNEGDGDGPSSGPRNMGNNNGDRPEAGIKSIHFNWDVTDTNQDELNFRLYYREVGQGNNTPWLLLAKDIKETDYEWPLDGIADGKYQVKLIASDSPDNSPETAYTVAKVSKPFIINTVAPAILNIKADTVGEKVTLTGTAQSKLSAITEIRYQIDTQEDWQPATASDKIFDSPTEGFSLTTRTLATGAHRITIRATDARGNVGYYRVTVSIK